ncbi:MAG TPA: hypothetical protein PKD55_02555 [Bellilinea sp.]|nr:hypothetical protein [Bellilinea sp.]
MMNKTLNEKIENTREAAQELLLSMEDEDWDPDRWEIVDILAETQDALEEVEVYIAGLEALKDRYQEEVRSFKKAYVENMRMQDKVNV